MEIRDMLQRINALAEKRNNSNLTCLEANEYQWLSECASDYLDNTPSIKKEKKYVSGSHRK